MKKIVLILNKKQWNELENIRCKVDEFHTRITYENYLKDIKNHPEKYTILFG